MEGQPWLFHLTQISRREKKKEIKKNQPLWFEKYALLYKFHLYKML
jgi:hypothetical protein